MRVEVWRAGADSNPHSRARDAVRASTSARRDRRRARASASGDARARRATRMAREGDDDDEVEIIEVRARERFDADAVRAGAVRTGGGGIDADGGGVVVRDAQDEDEDEREAYDDDDEDDDEDEDDGEDDDEDDDDGDEDGDDGDESEETAGVDAERGGDSGSDEADPLTGNYFGRAAAAPPAPAGANPFASAPDPADDVKAMIELAKRQCAERQAAREREEAADRERERRAFEDQGRTYEARRKPGEASEASPAAASSGERRKVVKARRPGASPLGPASDDSARVNAFAGFAALTGGAKAANGDERPSVFSRLSGDPTEKPKETATESETKPTQTTSLFTAKPSAEAPKPAAFGFFAPPPVLTKENVDTQRTIKPTANPTPAASAPAVSSGKKVKTALAIELGL